MNQYKKLGLFAILPLLAIAITPDYIVQVDALKADGSIGTQSPKSYGSATDSVVCGDRLCNEPASTMATTKEITYEDMPNFMPSIKTIQVTSFSGESENTFNAIYEITAGEKNIENIMILVESDVDKMLFSAGSLFASDGMTSVFKVTANDPMTITAQIVGFQLNN